MPSVDSAQQLNAAFIKHQAGDVDGAITLYRLRCCRMNRCNPTR